MTGNTPSGASAPPTTAHVYAPLSTSLQVILAVRDYGEELQLTKPQRHFLFGLATYWKSPGRFVATGAQVASCAGLGPSTLWRVVEELQDRGLLRVHSGTQHAPNVYEILLPPPRAGCPATGYLAAGHPAPEGSAPAARTSYPGPESSAPAAGHSEREKIQKKGESTLAPADEPRKSQRTAVADLVSAYRNAVAAARGRPWSFPPRERTTLEELVATFCADVDAEEWIDETVRAFAAAVRGKEKFYAELAPNGLRTWLNSDRRNEARDGVGSHRDTSRPSPDYPYQVVRVKFTPKPMRAIDADTIAAHVESKGSEPKG